MGFWDVLGDVADFIDPTPGNLIAGGITRIMGGNGGNGHANGYANGGGSVPGFRITNGGFEGVEVDVSSGGGSSLGEYLEYLVPDPIERMIGTMPANGNGAVAPCPHDGALGPVIVQPRVIPRLKAPKGYRIVECPKGSGRKVAMRTETARAYGYLPRRRKPPISARDWGALVRADRTVRKLDKVVQMSNRVVGKRKYTRSAGGRNGVSASATARATARRRK